MNFASLLLYSFLCPLSHPPMLPSLFVGNRPFRSLNDLSSSNLSSHVLRLDVAVHANPMESRRITRSRERKVLVVVGCLLRGIAPASASRPSPPPPSFSAVAGFGSHSSPFSSNALLFCLSSHTHRPSSGCLNGGLVWPFSALNSTSFWNNASKSKCLQAEAALCLSPSRPFDDLDLFGRLASTMRCSSASSACSRNGTAVGLSSTFSCCRGGAPAVCIILSSFCDGATDGASLSAVLFFLSFPSCTASNALSSLSLLPFSSWTARKVPSNLATNPPRLGTLIPAPLTRLRPVPSVSISPSSSRSQAKYS
mmetsp:Transcript_36518/g.77856  ORF Transcript_36518/g.77856 Transcript_36518/m.77856 type:complete len:310 (+) Transcript_36518:668-1597(+)